VCVGWGDGGGGNKNWRTSRTRCLCPASPCRWVLPYSWSWSQAALFGAITSAIDPIAVVALIKSVGASATLGGWVGGWVREGGGCRGQGLASGVARMPGHAKSPRPPPPPTHIHTLTLLPFPALNSHPLTGTVIEGESLLNDGVAYVLFELFRVGRGG
jgi:hypothetical protein